MCNWHPREQICLATPGRVQFACVWGESAATLLREHYVYVCEREDFYYSVEKLQITCVSWESSATHLREHNLYV